MSVFPSSLWEFSVSVYVQPGMEPLCLWLQDQRQANVNALLWALWLDEQGLPFNAMLWQRGMSRAAPWQRWLVEPLRWLRRRLPKRQPWTGLRARVQQWELQGERRQLRCLQALSDGCDFTPVGGDNETAGIGKNRRGQTWTGNYLNLLAGQNGDRPGELQRELQQIMQRWRQQREGIFRQD